MTPAEFKEARCKLGLTQSQLARILGVTRQTVVKWEMADDCSTSRGVNLIAAQAVRWMFGDGRPQEWPDPPA